MSAPTLRTERLTLRPFVMDDWDAYFECLASERARFMGGPFDLFGSWGAFASDAGQWALMGIGGLMIEDAGRVVGSVSIINLPDWPQEELGWFLYDGCEGRGYATEAAFALRDWYYSEHPAPVRLVSYIDPENAASARVAKRLGAVLAPTFSAVASEDLVYLHPAPDGVPLAASAPEAAHV